MCRVDSNVDRIGCCRWRKREPDQPWFDYRPAECVAANRTGTASVVAGVGPIDVAVVERKAGEIAKGHASCLDTKTTIHGAS